MKTCYLCPAPITPTDSVLNWKGHSAHQECVEKAIHESTEPAVPRRWEDDCPRPCDMSPGAPPITPVPIPPLFAVPWPELNFPGLKEALDTNTDKVGIAHVFPKVLIEDGPNAHAIVKECRDIAEMLLTKNRAYGSSFAVPLQVFSKLSPVEAIRARMDDKLARIKQAKDFSEDTRLDLIGYLILERIALKMEPQCSAAERAKSAVTERLTEILEESVKKPQSYTGARIPEKEDFPTLKEGLDRVPGAQEALAAAITCSKYFPTVEEYQKEKEKLLAAPAPKPVMSKKEEDYHTVFFALRALYDDTNRKVVYDALNRLWELIPRT